jgi:CRISPR/Cas system Type II protein with McrA/HNH and RuvC-like nuclease domain
MSGHVRQRGKKGQWYAVFDTIDPVTRKRKRRWQKLENCKGKRGAEKACERIIGQRDDGTYIEPQKNDDRRIPRAVADQPKASRRAAHS